MKKIIEYCVFVLMVSEDRKKGRKIKKIKKIYPGLSGSCFAAIHKKMVRTILIRRRSVMIVTLCVLTLAQYGGTDGWTNS